MRQGENEPVQSRKTFRFKIHLAGLFRVKTLESTVLVADIETKSPPYYQAIVHGRDHASDEGVGPFRSVSAYDVPTLSHLGYEPRDLPGLILPVGIHYDGKFSGRLPESSLDRPGPSPICGVMYNPDTAVFSRQFITYLGGPVSTPVVNKKYLPIDLIPFINVNYLPRQRGDVLLLVKDQQNGGAFHVMISPGQVSGGRTIIATYCLATPENEYMRK